MSADPDRFENPRRVAQSAPFPHVATDLWGDAGHTVVPAPRGADYVRAVARRGHIVAIIAACALLGAGIYLTTTAKKYDASANIVTTRSQLASTLFQSGAGQSADPERDVNTNLAVISSGTVAGRARQQLRVRTSIRQLLDEVTATTKGNSNVITVTVRDTQPARAAAIANAFATQYVRYQDETTRAQFSDGARSVQQRLRQMAPAQRSSAEGAALAQRLQQLQVAASVDTSGVRLLDPATPSTSPAVPRTKFVLALALIVGLLLGCLCAIGLATRTDPAFRS
jgi:uncharacterized protein involved in exopolysaccharide biosynthesis